MKKAISNLYLLTVSQYLSTLIRFLGGIYLARAIDPVFFGQQGLALSTVVLVWSFVMIGEDLALLRRQENVINYMQMLLFIRICIVCLLVSIVVILWAVGWLPGSIAIENYILILFLAQAFAQIASIYVAYLHKLMLFRRLAFLNLPPTIIAVSLACLLAFKGYKIWALLWLVIAEQLVQAILIILLTPKIFLPRFDKTLAKEFFHFSKYAISSNLLERFKSQIDNISIGSIIGEKPLGFYMRAYGLCGLLQSMLTGGLTAIIQPYFAIMQNNREKIGRNFELVGSLLVRIYCISFICLAFILPEVIKLLYGDKWMPAVPLFQLLLPVAILQGFRMILRNTHQVAGSIKLLTISQIFEVLTLIILLYPLIYWKGLYGVPIAVNISIIVGVGTMLFYLRHYAEFSIRNIFANPLIASMVAGAIMIWFKSSVIVTGDLLNVSITIGLFTCSFVVTLLLLEYSYIKKIISLFIGASR